MGRDLEPSVVRAIRAQLRAGCSAARISREMRLRQCVVQKYRRQFLARNPGFKCGCGRSNGHPGICSARRAHSNPDSWRRMEASVVEVLREMIQTGMTQRQIVDHLQVTNTTVQRHRERLKAMGAKLPTWICRADEARG